MNGLRWSSAQYTAWRDRNRQGASAAFQQPDPVDADGLREADHCKLLVQWARAAVVTHPDLEWLIHIPNGEKRSPATGRKLAAMGVQPGVPDFLLPVPRSPHHGLWLELKTADGRVGGHQCTWLARLRQLGYRAEVCRGWTAARDILTRYLEDDHV